MSKEDIAEEEHTSIYEKALSKVVFHSFMHSLGRWRCKRFANNFRRRNQNASWSSFAIEQCICYKNNKGATKFSIYQNAFNTK